MNNRLLLFLLFLMSFGVVRGQSTLSPGDISIIGFNSDIPNRDGHAFVIWVPISSGTVIRFTDNGFNSSGVSTASGGYRNGETILTWTSATAMPAGTVVKIEGDGNSPAVSASVGSVSVVTADGSSTNTLALGSNGDQIFAFQGTNPTVLSASSTFTGTLLSGVGWQGVGSATGWLTSGTAGSATSYLPSDISSYGLYFASGAVAAEYTGPRTGLTMAQYKAAVNNVANWTAYLSGSGVTAYNMTSFTTGSPAVITANPPNRTICAGSNTTFTVTATGAVGYQWYVSTDNGANFNTVSNTAPYSGVTTATLSITGATAVMNGYQYRCVVTGTSGNATSNAGTLTVSSIATTGSQVNVACNGGTNGSATVTASGGITPYSYSWAPSGGTASTATGLAAGSYTVTVTDNIGCTATRNYTVTQPPAISTTGSQVNVACNGGSNGSATVTASGGTGTGTYTYSWAPSGGTAATATGLTAGSYTVTVTDANNCSAIRTFTVTQPTAISTTGSQVNVACNGGSNGSATVTASGGTGTGTYTYSWAPSGGTAATATGLTAGNYTVTVTDANNCSAIRTFTVTQPTAIATTGSQVNVACNGGSNGSATVTASGGTGAGTYTYSWAPSGGTAASATGLTAGNYTVTVTDANNCSATRVFTITQPTAISTTGSQVNVACNGASNGSATVTASGGTGAGTYTYSWAPSGGTAASATGLTAGSYTVTVTDANNCSAIRVFTITQPTAISTTGSQVNVACNGASNGSATVTASGGTGSGTYTYSWAPSGGTAATATGLTAGNYTVTVTDANACSVTRNFTITQPTAIATTGSQVNVACNGASNGSATVTASGGTGALTYSWAPSGGTAATATGLTAGTYTVTVKDANNCTATRTFTITQPSAITTTGSQVNVACNGASNGSATVTASGGTGTGTYTYSWAPSGGTAATATGLVAGNYTVTVTDANNCSATRVFTITQPTAISSTGSQTNVACNGSASGSASVTVSGGTGPYTYSWAPSGGTAATATGLAAGSYTVTITDANACTRTRNFVLTQPTTIVTTGSQVNVACNGASNGSATVTASGGTGTGSYTYSWAPSGGTAATATGLTAGTYTVTVTDANNCTATRTFTITQPTAISTTGSQVNVACNGASNGSATVTASGGTGPLTYSWAPSGGTAATATGLTAGTYTVTVTDANNCSAIRTFTITQPTAISTTGSQVNIACNGGSTGTATVTASGGTGPYSYSWAPSGGTAASATGLAAGSYTVTVTDANSCSATRTFTVTQPTAITSSVTAQTNIACNGGSNGSLTVVASGGTGPYSYSWAPSGGTAATATGLTAGTYTLTITDANSCVKTQTGTITQPTAISTTGSQVNVACNGASNGSATVTASGGTGSFTYVWAPSGGTAATATGLVAGTYTVTVKDANNCTATRTFTITQPTAITTTGSQTNVSCNGGSNGSATVTASGGTGPYTYSWAPSGGTDASATGLVAGSYTVTVTDANNCSATRTFTVTQPTALTSTATTVSIACNGANNGMAIINPSGGTSPYTYVWTPNVSTTNTASNLAPGTYSVVATDNKGCTISRNFTITQPTALVATASNDTNICTGNTITIGVTASGGTPPYTYSWTPGNQTTATRTAAPTATTNYVVTVTDDYGCTKKDTVIVSVGGVLAQAVQSNATSVDGSDTSSSNVTIGNLNFMYNDDCKIIASVKSNPSLGTITGYVHVADTVPTFNNKPYVPRWYQVTPQNNLAASLNLYFTQQDFDEYNVYAAAHSMPLLPQNPTDQAGIDTLVITKVSGANLATGSFSLIHPDSVRWNPTLHFWTVSLSVPSFSYFLVHSNVNNTPLEVKLSSFTAQKEKNTTGLYWTTQSEQNSAAFHVERSADGRNYDVIGDVATKAPDGYSTATLNYSFTDKAPLSGMNFYRLALEDRNGDVAYSDVRTVSFGTATVFTCYPNPTEGQLVIEHTAASDNKITVRLTDVLGKTVLEKHIDAIKGFNKTLLDMSSLAQGIYNMVIIDNSGTVYHTRVSKK